MENDSLEEESLSISPPFIHVGNRSIRLKDVSGVSVNSGAHNAVFGCVGGALLLAVGLPMLLLGPLGWILGGFALFASAGLVLQFLQGAGGVNTIVIHSGGEEIEVYQSKDLEKIRKIKKQIKSFCA